MKKLFLTMIVALVAMVATAQTEPNRVLVHSSIGLKGFAIDKVDSMSFTRVDGEVKADVKALNFAYGEGDASDTIWLAITRSESCVSYKFDYLPSAAADAYTDDDLIYYFENGNGNGPYWQGFTNAQLTGSGNDLIKLKDNTSYTLFTVAYDEYGVPCEVSRDAFTTPRKPLIGNPTVSWTLDKTTPNSFTMTFTPSEDCGGYTFCMFEKGQAEAQFSMYAAMFGFANMSEMVKMFGYYSFTDQYTKEYTGCNPGTDYEVYILPWDTVGTYADMIVAYCSTDKIGGEGTAEVAIEVNDFTANPYYTEGWSYPYQKYMQNVVYTPNDQVAMYRDALVKKADYDTDEAIIEYLKMDNDMMSNDHPNIYDVDNVNWYADPSTTYYAVAIAQNINGEWGPLAKVELTTPEAPADTEQPTAAPAKAPKRMVKDVKASQHGVAPKLQPKGKGLKLVPVTK